LLLLSNTIIEVRFFGRLGGSVVWSGQKIAARALSDLILIFFSWRFTPLVLSSLAHSFARRALLFLRDEH